MPLLESGTSLVVPAGTTVQVAAEAPLVDRKLSASVMGILVNREDLVPSTTALVTFPHGAYVRLAADVATDGPVIAAGTTVLLAAGSSAEVVEKMTSYPPQLVASCDFPMLLIVLAMLGAVIVGGLVVKGLTED